MKTYQLNLPKQEIKECMRGLFDYLNYLFHIYEDEGKEKEVYLEEQREILLKLFEKIEFNFEKNKIILLNSEELDLISKGLSSTIFWIEKYKSDETDGKEQEIISYIKNINLKVESLKNA